MFAVPASRLRLLAALALLAGGLMVASPSALAGPHFPRRPRVSATLFVSGSRVVSHADRSCRTAGYSTIQAAVNAAAPDSRVVVCPGTYDEGVRLEKPLSLLGWGAVIDAQTSAFGNGVQIVGPGGSGSSVKDFTIENARFEGILVGSAPVAITETEGKPAAGGRPVSDVTIADNVVVNNDKGFETKYGQCFSTPEAPGDCGEALHLVAVTDSTVEGNYVVHNAGGILLTDEFGPTSDNVVRFNESVFNETDCGITLAGHAAAINPETGVPTGKAGVFDNLIASNVSDDNGVLGQGAGILMGGGAPYAGVYGNHIVGNVARGNGLAGITIHQHLVGDLNGNVLEGNYLSNDNLDGDFDFKVPDPEPTGILVAAGEPPTGLPPFLQPGPLKETVIRHNSISDVRIGVWTLGLEPLSTLISGNRFGHEVSTPISSH